MKLWTPYHEASSSDDDEENSPRAVKAKESPLPSISSSETWEKARSRPAASGLHHRTSANHDYLQRRQERTFVLSSYLSLSPVRVLPQHVLSPYRTPRRPKPSTVKAYARKVLQQPWHLQLFTLLVIFVAVSWSLTGLLYAYLPSWRGRSIPISITSSHWPIGHQQKHGDAVVPRPQPQLYQIELNALHGMKRLDSYAHPSSTTRRHRDSRKARLQSAAPRLDATWQPTPLKLDLSLPQHDSAMTVDESLSVESASMEALCGYASEMASLKHPQFFPADRALGDASRLVWIGPRWDALGTLLQACPSTQLLQIAHSLPDDPHERLQWLRKYPSLISSPDHHIRFVETVPMGLQTRETTQSIQLDKATHVVWALEAPQSTTLLTHLVQMRQMILDIKASGVSHLTVLAEEQRVHSIPQQEALVRLVTSKFASSIRVSWVPKLEGLVSALQMRHPLHPEWWKIDASLRHALLPDTDTAPVLPSPAGLSCASECSSAEHCEPSAWDDIVSLAQTVSEGCTVVVYTSKGDEAVRDLPAAEYREEEEGKLSVCNLAFVTQSSTLVQSVIQRIPNNELVRLGVYPQPHDNADALHERKLSILNGRLLYRGWILIWVATTWTEDSLLSLSPGNFWSADVQYSLYCDATVTPNYEDSKFLVHQMQRPAWPARNAKLKHEHYRLPEEPPRQAVVLVSERLSNDRKKKITSLRKAVSELQSEGTNSTLLHHQAALYEQYDVWMNRQRHQRRYYKPQPLSYRYHLTRWAHTRWILHNHQQPNMGTNFRCEWYKEVVHTGGSPALAFAHILALQEMERRWAFGEPDDHSIQHTLARRMAFKEALTDTHEWIPLLVEENRPFAQSAYRLDAPGTTLSSRGISQAFPDLTPLYVRIVSDRVIGAARKAYSG